MSTDRQKIPVPRRFFLWSLNETSGEILTHVGPTEFTPSANDRIVRLPESGGFEAAPMEARPFVIAKDGEYALLINPSSESRAAEPNGTYVPGGNKERDLLLGTRMVIPGPCAFPLWPGQSATVRPAHKLTPNHYLLCEVIGPVDEDAPYYAVVRDAAGLSEAVIDSQDDDASDDADHPRADAGGRLQVGQRIVIQGRKCQFFIPPTGIEVVPTLEASQSDSGDDDGMEALSDGAAEEAAKLVALVADGVSNKQFSMLKNELRHRQDLSLGERAIVLSALDEAFESRKQRARRSRESRGDRRGVVDPYARRAVVLGPKEFCVLFDADGNPRIVRGPARVSPGPNDTFMQRGSRRRVYDAYELGKDQALWLRVIKRTTRARLLETLPPGHDLGEGEQFLAGHELLVRGQPSVFFPFIDTEILNPITREPHFGNDHNDVVISAIGVDQKSGIYVRDLRNGMVNTVHGECSRLVDPRTEKHVHRRIAGDDWNLWIAHGEPHKRSDDATITTPWAVSVTIPNNEACLITSRLGRRVEEGPKMVLLDYEESLTRMRLSKGLQKDGRETISTCFLRVRGARVADQFEIESSDFVSVTVRLGFSGYFEGEGEARERWFQVENPVKLLVDSARARLREAARGVGATELLRRLPQLVRESLLHDEGALRFAENGMVIDQVDVLAHRLTDPELASLFADTQREAVKLQLKDDQASRRIVSDRHQDRIDAEENELLRSASKRRAETGRAEAEANASVERTSDKLVADRRDFQRLRDQDHAKAALDENLAMQRRQAELDNELSQARSKVEQENLQRRHAEQQAHHRALAEIEAARLAAAAAADSQKLAAIQPELVAALYSAADSEVMKTAAANMNLVSLLGGTNPAELLGRLLDGTPLARTPRSMAERSATEPAADEPADD